MQITYSGTITCMAEVNSLAVCKYSKITIKITFINVEYMYQVVKSHVHVSSGIKSRASGVLCLRSIPLIYIY